MTEVETKPLSTLKSVDLSATEHEQSENVTVFHDPQAFTVKHPLINKWTLWYTKPPTPGQRGADAWADNLKEVITFDSVEEFWGVYNNIAKATELSQKSDYHLFKQGVRPEWEDKQNQKGGKWAFQSKGASKEHLDDMWLYSMLAAIGETLEKDGDNEVMGVVVNLRKAHWRISVWTRTCNNKEGLLEVGRRFKEILRLPSTEALDFASHNDAAQSGSSRAKAKMVLGSCLHATQLMLLVCLNPLTSLPRSFLAICQALCDQSVHTTLRSTELKWRATFVTTVQVTIWLGIHTHVHNYTYLQCDGLDFPAVALNLNIFL